MISHKLQTLTIYVITLNANSSAILNSTYSIVCIFIRSGAAFWATGDIGCYPCRLCRKVPFLAPVPRSVVMQAGTPVVQFLRRAAMLALHALYYLW